MQRMPRVRVNLCFIGYIVPVNGTITSVIIIVNYMLKAELTEIISNGENSGVEFKRDDVRPEDLAKEIVAKIMLHSETLPVSGTSIDNLDLTRLTDYIGNIIGDSRVPKNESEWEFRLKNLGLMTDGEDKRCKCTIAGLVLFGYKPHKSLYQAGLRWMCFPGTDMDYKANDDAFLDAPLLPLGKGKIGEERETVGSGLIEKIAERMAPFISVQSDTINEQFRREKNIFILLVPFAKQY